MKRKFVLAGVISISLFYAFGLGSCINDLLFFVAPFIT